MDATERYVRDQNLSRFTTQLMDEHEPAKRETLRQLLVAEEDKYGSLAERFDRAEQLIAEARTRIRTLERNIEAHGAPDKADLHAGLLANHRTALQIIVDYKRVVGEALNRIDL